MRCPLFNDDARSFGTCGLATGPRNHPRGDGGHGHLLEADLAHAGGSVRACAHEIDTSTSWPNRVASRRCALRGVYVCVFRGPLSPSYEALLALYVHQKGISPSSPLDVASSASLSSRHSL